jgi:O-acetyl-ADP-ribose deacetylase (regulator of RNase III)
MKIIRGDLIELAKAGHFDVIIQGCNCQCRMGRGIALTIKQQFPEAVAADCQTTIGDRHKLGNFTTAQIDRDGWKFTIVNAYTQFHWQGEGVLADYDAIRSAFRQIKHQFSGQRIGYPKLGAGLARGDWAIISAAIDAELAGEEHTFVEFIGSSPSQS